MQRKLIYHSHKKIISFIVKIVFFAVLYLLPFVCLYPYFFLFFFNFFSISHSFILSFQTQFPVSMSLFPNWSILFLPVYFILLNIRNTNTLSLYMYCKNARTCINTSSTNGKSRDGMSIIPNKDLVASLV